MLAVGLVECSNSILRALLFDSILEIISFQSVALL